MLFLKAVAINDFSINLVVSGEIALHSTYVIGFRVNCDNLLKLFATSTEELGGIIEKIISLLFIKPDRVTFVILLVLVFLIVF